MTQEAPKRLLVVDTNIIISLIQAGHLAMLGRLHGYKAVLPDEVVNEVTDADQAAILSKALNDGVVTREQSSPAMQPVSISPLVSRDVNPQLDGGMRSG